MNSNATGLGGGIVAGGVWNNAFAPRRAAVWLNDGIREIGLGGPYSFTRGANRNGAVVGWARLAGPNPEEHGFVWDAQTQTMRDVGPLPGGHASALYAINAEGLAVGYSFGGARQPSVRGVGVLYFNGILWDLNDLVEEGNTLLEGAGLINARGQIVGSGLVRGQRSVYLLTPRG